MSLIPETTAMNALRVRRLDATTGGAAPARLHPTGSMVEL